MAVDIDYDIFAGKKPWKERCSLIEAAFPSVSTLEWRKVFDSDPSIAGKIINDIIRIDMAEPGRLGKRPAIKLSDASLRLRQMQSDDFSVKPFREAFIVLKGNRSIRHVSANVDIDKMTVHRLLNGKSEPTMEQIEKIAKGFKRHPSYFVEYRIAYVLGVLYERMKSSPESSEVFFLKMKELLAEAR